jgi:exoribonuclease-2
MVTDAMLMAGEAVARFALDADLPLAFVGQPPPEEIRRPETPAAMYAYRRLFKPSQASTTEQPHFGLGLELYTRVTSPLRRYMDLLNHQQLRRYIRSEICLSREQIGQRIAESSAPAGLIRRTERVANRHWTLAWLKRRPNWQGDAIVVDLEERRATILVPDIAFESRVRRSAEMRLDDRIRVALEEVNLPELEARWRKLG